MRLARLGASGERPAALAVPALVLWLTSAAPLAAQDARAPMPFSEVAAHVEGERVVVVALGSAADSLGPIAARRLSARTAARARAMRLLHRFVDDALATVDVSPAELRDVHAAVDASADLRRTRSLVDGSALVELALPISVLRGVVERAGLPW